MIYTKNKLHDDGSYLNVDLSKEERLPGVYEKLNVLESLCNKVAYWKSKQDFSKLDDAGKDLIEQYEKVFEVYRKIRSDRTQLIDHGGPYKVNVEWLFKYLRSCINEEFGISVETLELLGGLEGVIITLGYKNGFGRKYQCSISDLELFKEMNINLLNEINTSLSNLNIEAFEGKLLKNITDEKV